MYALQKHAAIQSLIAHDRNRSTYLHTIMAHSIIRFGQTDDLPHACEAVRDFAHRTMRDLGTWIIEHRTTVLGVVQSFGDPYNIYYIDGDAYFDGHAWSDAVALYQIMISGDCLSVIAFDSRTGQVVATSYDEIKQRLIAHGLCRHTPPAEKRDRDHGDDESDDGFQRKVRKIGR